MPSPASPSPRLDAVVVGSGPNGLAAAITLARAGRSVTVLEAAPSPGGGARTAELTLPGYHHDVCSAFHPMATGSPFFAELDLAAHGATLVYPDIDYAHPLDGGRAGAAYPSLERTMAELGPDGPRWGQTIGWVAERWDRLANDVLGPLVSIPGHPLSMAGFGARGVLPATVLARSFQTPEARALLAGTAAHAFLPLHRPFTSAFALLLGGLGHAGGWPTVRGGSGALTDALVSILESYGGRIECGRPVRSSADLPEANAVLFDLTPRQVIAILGDELPSRTRRRFERFRYGPAVFKVDYALSEPVPWTADVCRRAGTVHVGGTIDEIDAAETEAARGVLPERPFVLVGQQSLIDPTRTPEPRPGQTKGQTLWTYAHVPHGSNVDVTDRIEAQIERFAPGFRDTIVDRHRADARWYEDYNANNIGGDIGGGAHAGLQLLARPGLTRHPYRTGNPKYSLCSSSTPPGGGVHGMCGHRAALDVLATTLS